MWEGKEDGMGGKGRKRKGGQGGEQRMGREGEEEGREGGRGGDVEGPRKWSAPGPVLALGGPDHIQLTISLPL